jgi:tRNA(Ile)-lysidine synthase
MAKFIKRVQNFSSQYELWEKGSKIIVGVSGGPDSVCLLDMLCVLAKKYDFKLQIAHVNYGLRGQDSIGDEKLVKKLAEKYRLKLSILRSKKSLYKGNIENTLRNIRYEYFEKLRVKSEFDLVAVAHNQNDQAETVLMRIIRGAGLNGLSAMRPKTGKIIRPLLQISRTEIVAYLKEKKLIYRMDKSNEKVDILRNKIRQELLPHLQKKYNAAIIETLADFSFSVADDYDFIKESAKNFVNSVCKKNKAIFFDIDFLVLHRALQRQILRELIMRIKGQVKDVEYGHIEEIRKVIKSSKNKTKNATIGGLKISKKGAKIEIFG